MFARKILSQIRRHTPKTLVLILIFAVLAASFPQPAQAAIPRCIEKYYVESGDTLKSIAVDFQVKWADLAAANNLREPYTILVGQRLCIPSEKARGEPVTGKEPKGSAVDFTVLATKDLITIQGTKFPEKSTYFIKVDDAYVNGVKWYKIGVLNTRKSSSFKASFPMPKDLYKTPLATICLKNVYTDGLACKTTIVYR